MAKVRTRRMIGVERRIEVEDVRLLRLDANSERIAFRSEVGVLVAMLLAEESLRSRWDTAGVRCEGLEGLGRMWSVSGIRSMRRVPIMRMDVPSKIGIQFDVFMRKTVTLGAKSRATRPALIPSKKTFALVEVSLWNGHWDVWDHEYRLASSVISQTIA